MTMTTPTPQNQQPPAAAGPDGTTQTPEGDPQDLGEAGRRALQAERAARAEAERQLREAQTELATARTRIGELETSEGTLTTQISDLTRESLRYRVGVEQGLRPELVSRLQGDDEAALTADAQALLSIMGPATPASSTPRPDPSQGSRTPAPQTPEAAFAAAVSPYLT
jgi:TolA-binding protein